jgi:hypothetical protein
MCDFVAAVEILLSKVFTVVVKGTKLLVSLHNPRWRCAWRSFYRSAARIAASKALHIAGAGEDVTWALFRHLPCRITITR